MRGASDAEVPRMSEPASSTPAGWYPDPWKQAGQRWYDGGDWTGHVDGPVEAAAAAPVAALAPTPSPIQLHDEPSSGPSTMQPQLAAVPLAHPVASGTSGMAIAALTTGVIGVPIVPIVLGIKGRREIRRSGGALSGGWMAVAGIVLGTLQLLVIPAIIMAVAIPTFLAQKQGATATLAKANLKQVATAIESCAATNPAGSFAGCDATKLTTIEPAVGQQLSACGQPGGACVTIRPDGSGYTITAMDSGTSTTTFTQTFDGTTGALTRTCSGPACVGGTW
jgi:type II secretory pathway pseudopilin PulG